MYNCIAILYNAHVLDMYSRAEDATQSWVGIYKIEFLWRVPYSWFFRGSECLILMIL